jgi:hypothetical protein
MMITEEVARKVLTIVDAGLTKGMGRPIPGQMCVEAAVCLALGLPHSDDPPCVARSLRALKIKLNDLPWSSLRARAQGLRRLALIQLGSRDVLDDEAFAKKVADLVVRKYVPLALRAVACLAEDPDSAAAIKQAADRCEQEGTIESVQAARSSVCDRPYCYPAHSVCGIIRDAFRCYPEGSVERAVEAAYDAIECATRNYKDLDQQRSEFAEDVVQILIGMNAPGRQWLFLTEGETA